MGLIPGSGRATGRGNGTLLWYSCLKNPMERGAQWATVHGVAESDTTEHVCTSQMGTCTWKQNTLSEQTEKYQENIQSGY